MDRIGWPNSVGLPGVDYTCAFCGREVSASHGWYAANPDYGQPTALPSTAGYERFWVAICPRCGNPTYVRGTLQVPDVPFGDQIDYLPDEVGALYREARSSISAGNFTAATMVGRKLLMNVAHTKGAAEGQSFQAYVTHLVDHHIVTPDMEPWVDEIRKIGNIANHEIAPIERDEAEQLVTFVSMLLRVAYEYPGKHKALLEERAARGAGSSS